MFSTDLSCRRFIIYKSSGGRDPKRSRRRLGQHSRRHQHSMELFAAAMPFLQKTISYLVQRQLPPSKDASEVHQHPAEGKAPSQLLGYEDSIKLVTNPVRCEVLQLLQVHIFLFYSVNEHFCRAGILTIPY